MGRGRRALSVGAIVLCAANTAACSGSRCEEPPLPVEMSLARAAELAPDVDRGVALSTALRVTACPTDGADGGAPESTCGARDCGAERRVLDVLVVPSGVSLARQGVGCPRRASDVIPLAIARGTSSATGELVLALAPGEVSVFLVDPSADCAACGRLDLGEACVLSVPERGLVVRDLLLDRL